MIRYYFRTYGSLVAFDASYCLVASGKREVRLLVFRQSVICHLECCTVVTLLAAVAPRSTSKLPLVFILVAVDAKSIFDFELRIFSRQGVAGSTLYLRMRKDQRKSGFRVIGRNER